MLGQKGNESQAKKNPHKLLENLCPTKNKNGKSLVLISKPPEKKRERERDGHLWGLLFFMLHKSMILLPQTKIQRLFFWFRVNCSSPSERKRELPSQPRPISLSVFFFSNKFCLFILKNGEGFLVFFLFFWCKVE